MDSHPVRRNGLTDDTKTPTIKILLMHGLETPPDGGKKAILLREAFGRSNVLVPFMGLSDFKTFKNPYISAATAVLTTLGIGGFSCLYKWWQVKNREGIINKYGLLLSAQILVGIFFTFWCYRKTVRLMLKHSLRVQTKAIQEFKPDVVVGSSWGAGCAVHLLARRIWQGPTLLLAPAHDLVSIKAQKIPPNLPPNVPITIVHSLMDETVPFAGTTRLEKELRALTTTQTLPFLLQIVKLTDDDHKLSKAATKENLKEWCLDLYQRGQKVHTHQ